MRSTSARYGLASRPERVEQDDDFVSAQAVLHELAFLAADDEAGLLELLQVLGGVGDRRGGQLGEILDIALALGEQLQQVEAHRARQGGADAGEVLEDVALRIDRV